jgi:hypothetical protein
MSTRAHRRALDRLYAKIPAFACRPGCTDCCGPVVAGVVERERAPQLLESVAAAVAGGCASCPYGAGGSCEIYDDRPVICRIYGTVEDLRCPHGCGPDRLLSAAQGRALLADYHSLCGDTLAGVLPPSSAGANRLTSPFEGSSLNSAGANAGLFVSERRGLIP